MTASRSLRWLTIGLLAAIELALLFRGAALTSLNSDHVQSVLEATDILHGNILLHGWLLALQNFYLSDDPVFLLTRLLFGRTLLAIYAAPFIIYVALLLAAGAIVWCAAPDLRARVIGIGAVVFYLATPNLSGIGSVIFVGAQHIAVFAYCLLAWFALDAIARRGTFRVARGYLVLYAVCAFVALFSDPFAIVAFMIPTLIGLIFASLSPNRRLFWAELFGLTLLLFGAAQVGLIAIRLAGGFDTEPNQLLRFVSANDLGHNFAAVLFSLLTLSGGDVFDHVLYSLDTLVGLVRIAGLALMLAAMVAALRRGFRGTEGWNLRFVLALAMLIDLGACLVSVEFKRALFSPTEPMTAIRYLAPMMLFGGVLMALELPEMLGRVASPGLRRLVSGLCAAGLVLAAGSFVADGAGRWKQEPVMARSPGRMAGQWLLAHGLTQGVGTYWEGMLITALSEERLAIRAVRSVNGQLVPYRWVTNLDWYRERPQFVIYVPNNIYGITPQTIADTYGQPKAVEHVDGYAVAILPGAPK